MVVVLDVEVTPELEAEGWARDVVRKVQQARKEAGLAVTDRITLTVELPAEQEAALRAHEAWVREQVLAESLAYGPPEDGMAASESELGAGRLCLGLRRVSV
jgi:isoleucyl-tRNA synthetase